MYTNYTNAFHRNHADINLLAIIAFMAYITLLAIIAFPSPVCMASFTAAGGSAHCDQACTHDVVRPAFVCGGGVHQISPRQK